MFLALFQGKNVIIKYVDSADNLLDNLVYKHFRTARKSDAFVSFH
jgi:hypothetical protein